MDPLKRWLFLGVVLEKQKLAFFLEVPTNGALTFCLVWISLCYAILLCIQEEPLRSVFEMRLMLILMQ